MRKTIAFALLALAALWSLFLIPWGSLFVPGEEPLSALLRDPNHLMFEAITGGVQMLVIDVLFLAVLWPVVRRHIHRDIQHPEQIGFEANDRDAANAIAEQHYKRGFVAGRDSIRTAPRGGAGQMSIMLDEERKERERAAALFDMAEPVAAEHIEQAHLAARRGSGWGTT